jgi:hypothetical protein
MCNSVDASLLRPLYRTLVAHFYLPGLGWAWATDCHISTTSCVDWEERDHAQLLRQAQGPFGDDVLLDLRRAAADDQATRIHVFVLPEAVVHHVG